MTLALGGCLANAQAKPNSTEPAFACEESTQPKCANKTHDITLVGLQRLLDKEYDIQAEHSPDMKKGGWHIYEGGCDIYETSRKNKDGSTNNHVCVWTELRGEVCDANIQDQKGELCDPKGAAAGSVKHELKLVYNKDGSLLIKPIDKDGNYDQKAPYLRVTGDALGEGQAPQLSIDLLNLKDTKKQGSLTLVGGETKTPASHEDFKHEEVLCGRRCGAGGIVNANVTVDPSLKDKDGIERTNITTGQDDKLNLPDYSRAPTAN